MVFHFCDSHSSLYPHTRTHIHTHTHPHTCTHTTHPHTRTHTTHPHTCTHTEQWRSQNRVVAWAQVGQHIRCYAMCGKLCVGAHYFRGVWGHASPRKFRTSEIASAGFSGQVLSVAKIIHISSFRKCSRCYSAFKKALASA